MPPNEPHIAGRAAQHHPPNRFLPTHVEATFDDLESDDDLLVEGRKVPTQFMADASRSILTENNSPDVGFRWSINAYRGCEHGCAYCYARPTHEVFGLSAGLDFETKILVKHHAPALLREETGYVDLARFGVARNLRSAEVDRLLAEAGGIKVGGFGSGKTTAAMARAMCG